MAAFVVVLLVLWAFAEVLHLGRRRVALTDAYNRGYSDGLTRAQGVVQEKIDNLTALIPSDKEMAAMRLESFRDGVRTARSKPAPSPTSPSRMTMQGNAVPVEEQDRVDVEHAVKTLVVANVKAGGGIQQYDLPKVGLEDGSQLGDYEIRVTQLPP